MIGYDGCTEGLIRSVNEGVRAVEGLSIAAEGAQSAARRFSEGHDRVMLSIPSIRNEKGDFAMSEWDFAPVDQDFEDDPEA